MQEPAHTAPPSLPLSQRPRDWFFVLFFALFASTSLTSDTLHGLGLIDDTSVLGRANLWYGQVAGDDFFLAKPGYARFGTLMSAFVYGPFYLCLVYAFIKGKDWIRVPALLYVGAILFGTVQFLWWEFSQGQPPRVLPIFFAFYGPYVVVPLLLAVRLRHDRPFSAKPSA